MKNKTLQICSFLVLAILSAVISTQAQTIKQYRADIPFDFTIGNKTYPAGEYLISLQSENQPATAMTVRNVETREVKQLFVIKSGATAENSKTILQFDRWGDQYVLKQLLAPDFGYNAPKPKAKKRLAGLSGQSLETVTIALTSIE